MCGWAPVRVMCTILLGCCCDRKANEPLIQARYVFAMASNLMFLTFLPFIKTDCTALRRSCRSLQNPKMALHFAIARYIAPSVQKRGRWACSSRFLWSRQSSKIVHRQQHPTHLPREALPAFPKGMLRVEDPTTVLYPQHPTSDPYPIEREKWCSRQCPYWCHEARTGDTTHRIGRTTDHLNRMQVQSVRQCLIQRYRPTQNWGSLRPRLYPT